MRGSAAADSQKPRCVQPGRWAAVECPPPWCGAGRRTPRFVPTRTSRFIRKEVGLCAMLFNNAHSCEIRFLIKELSWEPQPRRTRIGETHQYSTVPAARAPLPRAARPPSHLGSVWCYSCNPWSYMINKVSRVCTKTAIWKALFYRTKYCPEGVTSNQKT